jgi:periplasmic divalent cation tolerance protein
MSDKIVVLITCRSVTEARRISRKLVDERLAACVNILRTPVESIYRWQGNIESAREILLIIKTSRGRFKALGSAVKRLHSYEVPEIIALPIERGWSGYLAWVSDSVITAKKRRGG